MQRFEINPKKRKMSRKFLFCFPLRTGNIIFGYIVIILSIVLILFEIYQLYDTLLGNNNFVGKFKYLESHFNEIGSTIIILTYFVIYILIGFLLFLFGTIFIVGAHKLKFQAIKVFFVYSFIHIFITLAMIAWEAQNRDWVMLGILVVTDVWLIVSLFGVKYFIDAVKSGRVYHRPEAPRY